MQINYDLRSLFRDTKAVEIGALKRDCEMKAFLTGSISTFLMGSISKWKA